MRARITAAVCAAVRVGAAVPGAHADAGKAGFAEPFLFAADLAQAVDVAVRVAGVAFAGAVACLIRCATSVRHRIAVELGAARAARRYVCDRGHVTVARRRGLRLRCFAVASCDRRGEFHAGPIPPQLAAVTLVLTHRRGERTARRRNGLALRAHAVVDRDALRPEAAAGLLLSGFFDADLIPLL